MRLIDADKMSAELLMINERSNIFAAPFARRIKRFIDRQPTIEARKHGHWIGKPIAGYANVRCSVCGMVFRQNTGKWKSCPECTAIMDEEAQ